MILFSLPYLRIKDTFFWSLFVWQRFPLWKKTSIAKAPWQERGQSKVGDYRQFRPCLRNGYSRVSAAQAGRIYSLPLYLPLNDDDGDCWLPHSVLETENSTTSPHLINPRSSRALACFLLHHPMFESGTLPSELGCPAATHREIKICARQRRERHIPSGKSGCHSD